MGHERAAGSIEWTLFLATILEVIERGESGIPGEVSALVGVDGRANNPEYRQLCDVVERGSAAGLLLVNSAMIYLLPVLQTPGLPRAAIEAPLPHAGLVKLDFPGLIERATARLLEKGRRIAVMSPHLPKLAAAEQRLRALGQPSTGSGRFRSRRSAASAWPSSCSTARTART